MGKADAKSLSTAQRLANWASNLFVSGVVIVVALTFGRQTIHWWRADDSGLNSRDLAHDTLGRDVLSPEAASHLLEFGDSPFVFNRIVMRGDAPAALANLRRYCGQAAGRSAPSDAPPSAAETRALADLTLLQPVAEQPGHWQMFENPAPLPMVLVATPRKTGGTGADSAANPPANLVEVVEPERRVLSWGLAFPRRAEAADAPLEWTLFVWSPSARRSSAAELPFALPAGSQRLMTLRSEAGGAITAFRGRGSLAEWRGSFDAGARQRGWNLQTPWREVNQAWGVVFESDDKTTLSIQLTMLEDDQLQGLATLTPPAAPLDPAVPREKGK